MLVGSQDLDEIVGMQECWKIGVSLGLYRAKLDVVG
jgi:hypothetical protein